MPASLIAGAVFLLLTAALLAGRHAALRLPSGQTEDATKESVKRATAFIVTLAALVLGLLVSNGKGAFDRQSDAVANIAARVAQLDDMLRQYGPEAAPVREEIRGSLSRLLLSLWSGQPGPTMREDSGDHGGFVAALQALPAGDARQASIKARAVTLADALVQDRFRLAVMQVAAVPGLFLGTVVIWLVAVSVAIGFCSAPSATALAVDIVGAFCAATAILLILEFDEPFSGWLRVSHAPVDVVLAMLGRP